MSKQENLEHNYITPYNSQFAKKQQVEEMFDNIANKYDLLNHILSMKIDVAWRNKLVNWLKRDAPENILDVATGTGDLAILLQKNTGTKVIGYDLSQKMLDVGIEKIKKKGLSDKIQMIKGDAENMPFDNESFDSITCAFGIRNFENLTDGLQEMKRVLKTGSSMYILEFSQVKSWIRPFYNFYFKRILPLIGKMLSKDQKAYNYLHDSANAFPCGEKMKNIFLEVGYQKVEYKKLTLGIATIYKVSK